jgi:hypothetical protein
MSVHKSLFSQVRYSAGRGHGLFAAEDVPRGGLVAEYVGEVITYDEWARYVGWLAGWFTESWSMYVDVAIAVACVTSAIHASQSRVYSHTLLCSPTSFHVAISRSWTSSQAGIRD